MRQTTFRFDELDKAAQEKALDTIRGWQGDYGWWGYTIEDFVDNVLPDQWAITDVSSERVYFDTDRARSCALTDGMLNLRDLMQLKPEWFDNLYVTTAINLQNSPFRRVPLSIYRYDTRGVDDNYWGGCYLDEVDLEGTPFAGADIDEFNDALHDALEALVRNHLHEHAKDAADALLKALDAEYDHQTSDETCREIALGYTFDAEGDIA